MTLEKFGQILDEIERMESFYGNEVELAGKADVSAPNYHDFVEDGLKRIAQRQEVEIDIVRGIYNKTKNED